MNGAPNGGRAARGAEENGIRFTVIDGSMQEHPLRICVALHAERDGRWGLILLRSTVDARVYLGGQVDAAGTLREWLEVWVQTTNGLMGSVIAEQENLTNQLLDERWRVTAERWRGREGPAFIATGWETCSPRPSFIDTVGGGLCHPVEPESGAELALCTDDSVLRGAGLPEYTRSLRRYWATVDHPAGARIFFAAWAAPVESEGVARHPAFTDPAWLPFNPEGGLMMVRRHAPLALEDFLGLLAGKPWPGIVSGQRVIRPEHPFDQLSEGERPRATEALLLATGRAGRLAESFHLRVRLVHDLVVLVERVVQEAQLPFLNLSAESFRVELSSATSGWPLLWTGRPVLSLPGNALARTLPSGGRPHILPLEAAAASIYRPNVVDELIRGEGAVRLRRVFTDAGPVPVVEGTLVTSERPQALCEGLLCLRLPLRNGLLELFAQVDAEEGLAPGEVRFRSVPQDLGADALRWLQEAEGATFPRTTFERVRVLDSAADLYALGVLAVRVLLVNQRTTLGVALDEVLSLARQLATEAAPADLIGMRVQRLAAADSRWSATLGAQRLAEEVLTPEEAFELFPAELWWQAVGTIARMFPGYGPQSYCRSFCNQPDRALETVFARPAADLGQLVLRSRALLFPDGGTHREVRSVIERLR